jgi:hypothetical protein
MRLQVNTAGDSTRKEPLRNVRQTGAARACPDAIPQAETRGLCIGATSVTHLSPNCLLARRVRHMAALDASSLRLRQVAWHECLWCTMLREACAHMYATSNQRERNAHCTRRCTRCTRTTPLISSRIDCKLAKTPGLAAAQRAASQSVTPLEATSTAQLPQLQLTSRISLQSRVMLLE